MPELIRNLYQVSELKTNSQSDYKSKESKDLRKMLEKNDRILKECIENCKKDRIKVSPVC